MTDKQIEKINEEIRNRFLRTNEQDEGDLPKVVFEDNKLLLAYGEMKVGCDFSRMLSRSKINNLNGELIVKASNIKGFIEECGDNPLAIDATAGLGDDTFLLAAAGFKVRMFERDSVIAALLIDGLRRAREEGIEAVERMELVEGDSIEALKRIGENEDEAPKIILLDPMFPERKKSSLVKKKLQLLQQLETPCEDEEALIEAAVNAGAERIIIKRPAKGPYLGGYKPTFSLKGKAVRIDCIVLPKNHR